MPNEDGVAKTWQAILERARVETLASGHLPGMAHNLLDLAALAPRGTAHARVYQAARAIFTGDEPVGAVLPDADRTKTTRHAPGLLARLRDRLQRPVPAPDTPDASTTPPLTEADARAILVAARSVLSEPMQYAKVVSPLVQWLARQGSVASVSGSPSPAMPAQADTQDGDLPGMEAHEEAHDQADLEQEGPGDAPATSRTWPDYAIYSTRWDETLPAARYVNAEDTQRLHALDGPRRAQTRKLAHRLQRRLLAARLRTWSFDQEEGRLDSRRLARLLIPGGSPAVFRQELESPIPDACVTLLVDQSGSMNADRRHMVALAIDLAVHTLETCRVSTEVLGYTTRFGADNPLVRQWQARGHPPAPGRLNALRHIVYKTVPQPWRRCRTDLGLLLREGFGRENIDGEALDWAARRLAERPEPRKILIVLSDGSPYDAATHLAHDRGYLEHHLRQVIATIEASPIHLAGIGAGQAVGRFYRQALTLRHPDDVAQALFEHLGELLTRPDHES